MNAALLTCNRGRYTVRRWLYLISKLVRRLSFLLFITLLRMQNMDSFQNNLNMLLFLLQVSSFLCLAMRGCNNSSGFTGNPGFNYGHHLCWSIWNKKNGYTVTNYYSWGFLVYMLLHFVVYFCSYKGPLSCTTVLGLWP